MKLFFLTVLCSLFFLFCANNSDAPANSSETGLGYYTKTYHEGPSSEDTSLAVRRVLSGEMEMLLPARFVLMSDEMIDKKYPQSAQRPDEVYTNDKGTINIALNRTENNARSGDLPLILNTLEQQMGARIKNVVNRGVVDINDGMFGLIEFMSTAKDAEIYNLIFITTLEGKLVIGNFNCTSDFLPLWKTMGEDMVRSCKMTR